MRRKGETGAPGQTQILVSTGAMRTRKGAEKEERGKFGIISGLFSVSLSPLAGSHTIADRQKETKGRRAPGRKGEKAAGPAGPVKLDCSTFTTT